jgi:sugar-specific transcriptional regulator TrmB
MEREVSQVKFHLMNMGLNEYQASALSHLIYLGETKATTLSKASGVPNARIYGILDGLSKMGLITIKPGRPALYSPMAPEDIASALISDAREEIRRRLNIIQAYSQDFMTAANLVFLKGGRVGVRTPLLRIVSVGEASMQETKKLYLGAKESIRIMTRAMEYYEDVSNELKEVISSSVDVKVIMMSDKNLTAGDRGKRDTTVRKIKNDLRDRAVIRLSDEVRMRGCIVDPESEGRALFLVEEVGVPYFLREAAISSHPGVVKGLSSLFDMIWKYESTNI